MRRTGLALVIAMLALLVPAGTAFAKGNDAGAKACQKGGWRTVYGITGAFANQDACVSYTAKGGLLVLPCYDGGSIPNPFTGGFVPLPDLRLTAPLDTLGNASFFGSTDGTCTGEERPGAATVVTENGSGGTAKCISLGFLRAFSANSLLGYSAAPSDWSLCDRTPLPF